MTNPHIFFNEVNERQGVFHRRAFLMGGVAGAGLLALGGRLAYLQLVEADKYKVLSLNNEFQSRLQPPPRGLILDRNGVVLASNRPDFRLYVSRDENTDVEDLLDRLEKLVPLDDAHRSRLIEDINDAPRRAPVTVLEDLTWEEFSRINVRAPELPGVTAIRYRPSAMGTSRKMSLTLDLPSTSFREVSRKGVVVGSSALLSDIAPPTEPLEIQS